MNTFSFLNIDAMYKIGEVAKQTGLTADTLRYYEKFGLLPDISRDDSGLRLYDNKDISRLNFIKRAQRMNFRLDEIKQLLLMRADPQHARDSVRQLTADKLEAIENQLVDLEALRKELRLLLNLCRGSADDCPIIKDMDGE